MAIKPETVDRILLSRSFIEPLRFRPASDRFTVATHVLPSHDAAELAIAAICTEKSAEVSAKSTFVDYFGKLKDKLHPNISVRHSDAMSQLNAARVGIKHHGLIPDWEQWGNIAERTFGYISDWCLEYLSIDFASLDRSALIAAESVRNKIQQAREALRADDYRGCLEALAGAIDCANFDLFAVGVGVSPGRADAETALLLSGYGVDPGRFLTLQRLLPKRTVLSKGRLVVGFSPLWEKRSYGHEGNWTQENAEFAYAETVNLLTRLQVAVPYPTPYSYHSVFEDVVKIKREGARAVVMQWSFQNHWFLMGYRELSAGEELQSRQVNGSMSDQPANPQDDSLNPDDAPFVVAVDVRHPTLDSQGYFTFVLRREDVEVLSVEMQEDHR